MEPTPSKSYGEIRQEDIPLLETALSIFKRHHLRAGLHGTSLWNPRYKDLDIIVIPESGAYGSTEFLNAINELREAIHGKVHEQRGNETLGFDLEMEAGNTVLHISYVILF